MRKLAALLLVFSMLAAACGDSGGSGDFSSCDDLAQGGLDLIQDIIDEVDSMSMEEFIEASDTEGDPEFITKFESDADQLDAAQVELGCTDDELGDYIVANIGSLNADGPVGELLVEALRDDPDVFGLTN